MPIKYLKGDATNPIGKGIKIITHIVNNFGGWGAGFVLAINKKWKEPEAKYREWSRKGEDFDLGNVQFVEVCSDIIVANMLAQKGFGGVAVQHNHLRTCLAKVREYAKSQNASIHMPRIGTGLGGSVWSMIEPIIEEELTNQGVEVTVYDFKKG
jgi:O-acetyl-ADP-ribose deacetylase (regulator of RNase III)